MNTVVSRICYLAIFYRAPPMQETIFDYPPKTISDKVEGHTKSADKATIVLLHRHTGTLIPCFGPRKTITYVPLLSSYCHLHADTVQFYIRLALILVAHKSH